MLVVLGTVFLPFAFSYYFLEALLGRTSVAALIAVDVAAIGALFVTSLLVNGRRQVRRALRWWIAGLILTVILDAALGRPAVRRWSTS